MPSTLAPPSEIPVPVTTELPSWRAISLPVFTLVALVLARRALYSSPDDADYLAYFADEASTVLDSWRSWLLEEPLWLSYARSAGAILGPEGALRATIFAATLGFLLASSRLARGAWVFVLFSFLFDQSMASLFFNIQLRNGLALTVFLVVFAMRREAVSAAVVAAFIHTSFLVIVPCAVLARVTSASRWPRTALVAGLLLIAAGVVALGRVADSMELGRRSGMYEATSGSNANFYALAVTQYLLVVTAAWARSDDEYVRRLFHLATVFFVCSLALTFIHEAAVRLVFMSHAVSVVTLGACMDDARARRAGVAWVGILILLVIVEYAHAASDPDSWFARWHAILTA